MTSVIRTRSATDNYMQHESYIYRRVNWNDRGITLAATAGGLMVGVLPGGAQPLETIVRINTAFTEGLTIGTTADGSEFVTAGDLAEGSTGTTLVDRCASVAYTTADKTVYARTSTVATAGQADIWVRYYGTVNP